MTMANATMDIDTANQREPSPIVEESQVKLRSYQEEMLEASLKQNIIIAMDTGSGKTHVAIFRILAELEISDLSTLVWFMTPSVALCDQQYQVLADNLPGYLIKTLVGRDGVDKWSEQRLWDAFLLNVRVVVSTPAVLEQALTHGFVKISRLRLLVFDEAHRCVKGSPMNSIMANFYHPTKRRGDVVPHILGLTASPVMSGNTTDLRIIEANLDARAITPKLHRAELESYVSPPAVYRAMYNTTGEEIDFMKSPLCQAIQTAVDSYDLSTDPYIMELQEMNDEESQRQLDKHKEQPKTYCYKELKALRQRSKALLEQLGLTAAEWYLRTCIDRFLGGVQSDMAVLSDITEKEWHHLKSILQAMPSSTASEQLDDSEMFVATEKVGLLINVLLQHASSSVRGIIFVEQRAVVHSLAHLLRRQPEIRDKFGIGTFVGLSTYAARASIADFSATKEQQQNLEDFRNGTLNLMIATDVLQEGIDVSACNLVICFDVPRNLVSYVQRRGRARQRDSKYIIFLSSNQLKADPSKWQRLEVEMKQAYMDELRQVEGASQVEADDLDSVQYRVESTGALLTLQNAKAHLYHFCAVGKLDVSSYIDMRPTFNVVNNSSFKPYTAQVQLPSFVHPDVRTANSLQSWHGEPAAIKDAALQSYIALHKAGLVNDNLLPLVKDWGPDEGQLHLDQPSIVEVSQRLSSWKILFERTGYDSADWHGATLRITLKDRDYLSVSIWLPTAFPRIQPFPLYWNEHTTYMVEIEPTDRTIPAENKDSLAGLRRLTRTILRSVHSNRMPNDLDDFPVLFSTVKGPSLENSFERLAPATLLLSEPTGIHQCGLIRVQGFTDRPFLFSRIETRDPGDADSTDINIVATPFPKRRDFLHPITDDASRNAAYTTAQSFPIQSCTVDKLPSKYAVLAAFVPSIMHQIDIALLVQNLQITTLSDVGINDASLVVEAISSPSAGEVTDYNRLEFLGDTILKFCTVLQVVAQHPNWPERYLQLGKDRIVNNNNLAKAAIQAGLDKFIHTKAFTGNKWRPVYVSELLSTHDDDRREMSSKVLADVVEALIGAAYVDGGLEKALDCIEGLLPDEEWYSPHTSITTLLSEVRPCQTTNLASLEKLIGHNFNYPTLLIEAITHASFPNNQTGLSYERLEFLGDAVLDLILVPKLFSHPRKLKHWQLHTLLGALVNADFLAFCSMNYGVEEERYDVISQNSTADPLEVRQTTRSLRLHDFLRAGVQVMQAKKKCLERFEDLRLPIQEALQNGSRYPWTELTTMGVPKFMSDIVESVLGALYLDSSGDLSVCEAFVDKLGIFKYMQLFLDDQVETMTPKEMLGILAGQETVKYATSKSERDDGKKVYTCSIQVGDADIATVDSCYSRYEAEVRAASEGCRILEAKSASDGSLNRRKRKIDLIMTD